jgi:general L-amino acid transport system permease protein
MQRIQDAPAPLLRPPQQMVGPLAWARDNLFSSWGNAILTVLGAYIIFTVVTGVIGWAIIRAVWTGEDGKACPGPHYAACWPFITAKFSQFMYGRFPDAEVWRVKLAYLLGLVGIAPLMIPRAVPVTTRLTWLALVAAVCLMMVVSTDKLPFNTGSSPVKTWLLAIAIAVPAALLMNLAVPHKGANLVYMLGVFPVLAYWLLTGGTVAETRFGFYEYFGIASGLLAVLLLVISFIAGSPSARVVLRATAGVLLYIAFLAGVRAQFSLGAITLPIVKTELWGGLLVTLVVAIVGIVGSFPVGIALALGRRSKMPIVRWVSVGFIEFVRGVPLISILFMASVMLPLFLPGGITFDKLLRALIGVMLFQGAYMAETIRGGLQAIPRGQGEAADSLGLGYGQKMGLIILPQALKLVIPGIVNSIVGLTKDTSLVLIIGLFDLLGIVQLNLADPKWLSPNSAMTGYAFVGALFWVICFGISRYSQWIERRLNTSR